MSLTEDVLYVREDRVLAFDGTLSWETGTVPGADMRMLQFRGRGIVALALGEAPIAIKVTEDRPTLLTGARLVGWVGRLVPHGAPVARGGTRTRRRSRSGARARAWCCWIRRQG